MAQTKLQNLINPEVMADMVSAKLPKKIKFSNIAAVDTTLTGVAGNEITVPKYKYIGDAEDVAEGVAMGTTVLTASTTKVTIKKAGKAVEITDEAVLSGYGDPVGQAANQIVMSIAAKVDNDCYDALCGASLIYDSTGAVIGYNGVVEADGIFADEADTTLNKLMYIHPEQETTLRKDENFIDRNKFGGEVMASGVIGKIAGVQVRKSKKVRVVEYEKNASGTYTIGGEETSEDGSNLKLSTVAGKCLQADVKIGDKVNKVTAYYACPIVILSTEDADENAAADGNAEEEAAITVYLKRDVQIETDRDILAKTSVISADEHYGVALSNESKVVLAKFKK